MEDVLLLKKKLPDALTICYFVECHSEHPCFWVYDFEEFRKRYRQLKLQQDAAQEFKSGL